MITIGSTGGPIAIPATNNRTLKGGGSVPRAQTSKEVLGATQTIQSAQFQTLDASILNLDAQYDALADQTPWEGYAANITGEWNLCANCEPDAGGKKLYRQYNFNRRILGLPVVDVPINDTEHCPSGNWSFAIIGTEDGFFNNGFNPVDTYYLINVGKAMGNPLLLLTAADIPATFPPGSPLYDFMAGLPENQFLTACTMLPDGAPGKQVGVIVEVS